MNRVLIVDDEQSILDTMSYLVEGFGFTPLVARTAQEAIDIFRKEKPGIVVTDLRLESDSADGVALCSRIRYEDNTTVLIAMSSHFDDYDKVYSIAAGFTDFISKPISSEELSGVLQCAFDRRSRWCNLP